MTLVGLAARKLMNKKRTAKLAAAFPNGVRCQKCLQMGHWSYECKEKRKFVHRSSRTKQLNKRIAEKRSAENSAAAAAIGSQSGITEQNGSSKVGKQPKVKRRKRSDSTSTSSSSDSSDSSSDSSDSDDSGSSDSAEDSTSSSSSSSGSSSDSSDSESDSSSSDSSDSSSDEEDKADNDTKKKSKSNAVAPKNMKKSRKNSTEDSSEISD